MLNIYVTILLASVQILIITLLSALSLFALGVPVIEASKVIFYGAVNYDAGGFFSTLHVAANLIFMALAFAIPARAGLFNIGAEGQAIIAATAFAAVAIYGVEFNLSPWLVIAGVFISSIAFGALWSLIPAWLYLSSKVHIVVSTIMLNLIASPLMGWVFKNYVGTPELGGDTSSTRYYDDSILLPDVFGYLFPGVYSSLNVIALLSIVCLVLYYIFMERTRSGLEIKIIGNNPDMRRYLGLSYAKSVVIVMVLAGGLTGLFALNESYMGTGRGFLNYSAGAGFLGIAVALMGNCRAMGMFVSAIIFGGVLVGISELQYSPYPVSKDFLYIMQAIVMVVTGGVQFFLKSAVKNFIFSISKVKG